MGAASTLNVQIIESVNKQNINNVFMFKAYNRESVVGCFLDNHLFCVMGRNPVYTYANRSVYDVVHRPHQCIYSHSSYLENY